ncbi:TlpA family protein disulfide reductase [Mucilaginibacter ginsenosidivorans]|uniref:TlpA family protein disulfide reductase n=1 Tax=Mucilaginibacter ginsenosidivorans TaxID=398053 RepID=A0A5B8UWQ5_9SPHI|nr:TlpA disulfide reductase family protein [Mucilaginibacter ginsenosidivorans]QEC63403.1 TlpA family protein disulfide reductase [Mucilaginibacter ginsenosidivorans]
MNFKKITWSQISTVLMVLFVAVYLYSARMKSWVIMGLMMIGFFKPDIPQIKPGEKNQPAPTMLVQNLSGKSIDLQQQKGKVVFVNFWATWCPPCLAELPSINSLYEKVKADTNIVFVMVDVDNDLANSTKFLKNKRYQLPVYGGDAAHVPNSLFGEGIPTTIVVDKKGDVVFRHLNRAKYDDEKFVQYITNLAAEQ